MRNTTCCERLQNTSVCGGGVVTTSGCSLGSLMALPGHPDRGVLNWGGGSQAVPEDHSRCHGPISLHTQHRCPQGHGPWASVSVLLPTIS